MASMQKILFGPIATIGLILVVGTFFAYRLTTGCPFTTGRNTPASENSSFPGGEDMTTNARSEHGVLHATEATFDQMVLSADTPVLVDFYADWCVPCQMLAPTLDEFARKTADVRVVKVNVDENPQLANEYRISSIPNLKVFKDGEVVASHLGLATKAEIDKMVSR